MQVQSPPPAKIFSSVSIYFRGLSLFNLFTFIVINCEFRLRYNSLPLLEEDFQMKVITLKYIAHVNGLHLDVDHMIRRKMISAPLIPLLCSLALPPLSPLLEIQTDLIASPGTSFFFQTNVSGQTPLKWV